MHGLATTARNRGRVHEALGKLGARDEANAAAVVAAVVGGIPAKEAYEKAQSHFSGIPFSSLTFDDFLRKDLAAKDNPEAMVVIGNLYAKGAEVKRSTRKAVRWYKKAVAQAQASFHGNAAIVNEVAWTLAVTDQKDLQKPDYAQAIMDTMMQNNKQVQNHPEYLDTWAATYAANGNFPKAIELQKRALHFARSQERTDVIAILQTHLESFEAGANITDRTP